MSYLSFEVFQHAMHNAFEGVVQPGRGIVHRGKHANSPQRRYNSRELQKHHFCEVEYFIDHSVCAAGLPECIWYWGEDPVTGYFSGFASLKRGYYPLDQAFHNALDFDMEALRRLYRNGPIGWRGIPWHIHLADVAMAVMTEPPPEALPWKGHNAEALPPKVGSGD